MHGEVKVWYMTEEERLAYIKKNPIVPVKRKKGSSYVNIYFYERGERNENNN